MKYFTTKEAAQGGSRSTEGAKTRLALASLFETWNARGLNPLEECHRLLSQPTAP